MYKLKQILTGATFALITGLATMSGNAVAEGTPDGETPANEGVCDGLQSGTPGLYGLCVAYCEAQDLDSTDKKPPSLKILENYNKKKQAGDPDMPCTSEDFGCFTQNELDSIVTTNNCNIYTDGDGTVVQYGNQSGFDTHYVKVDSRPAEECTYLADGVVRHHFFESQAQVDAALAAVMLKCP